MRRNAQEEGPANCCKFQIAARSKDLIGVFKKHIISQPPIQSRFYEKKQTNNVIMVFWEPGDACVEKKKVPSLGKFPVQNSYGSTFFKLLKLKTPG